MPTFPPALVVDPSLLDPLATVVVRCTAGLEKLLSAELESSGRSVLESSRRQVVVSAVTASILACPPRLADDLFVQLAEATDRGSTRAALAESIAELGDQLTWTRDSGGPGPLAVSASFVGRRSFTRFDVEDAVGALLLRHGFGPYVSRRGNARPPGEAIEWRVTLDGRTLRVGIRPFARPLHRRPWRGSTVLGSLHPPVAAAMLALAEPLAGHVILDPCCGAGTILLEAAGVHPSATLIGSDRDPAAIRTAASNDRNTAVRWAVADASALPWQTESVDRIVTNPPWGLRRPAADLGRLLTEWRRVLRPDGRLVTLLPLPLDEAVRKHPEWIVEREQRVSVAGTSARVTRAAPRY